MDKQTRNYVFGAIALAVIALIFMPTGEVATPTGAVVGAVTEEGGTIQPTTGVSIQQTVSSTTLSLAPYDFYAPGVTLDVEGVVQRGNGTLKDSGALATDTVTVNPGETLFVAMWSQLQTTAIDGTTAISVVADANYYGWKGPITVPYAPTYSFSKALYKETAYGHWATNPNGQVNSTTAQWDLGASETDTAEITLKGPSNACYGNPYAIIDQVGIVIVIDANTSLYNKIEILEGTSTAMPSPYLGTGDWAYELPFSAVCGTADKKILNLRVSTGSAPPVSATADINFYVMDPQLYYQEDAGTTPVGFRYSTFDESDQDDLGLANTNNAVWIQ